MKYERTENRSAFYYSKNLLDRLLRLNVITVNEYEKILNINADYYCCTDLIHC